MFPVRRELELELNHNCAKRLRWGISMQVRLQVAPWVATPCQTNHSTFSICSEIRRKNQKAPIRTSRNPSSSLPWPFAPWLSPFRRLYTHESTCVRSLGSAQVYPPCPSVPLKVQGTAPRERPAPPCPPPRFPEYHDKGGVRSIEKDFSASLRVKAVSPLSS